MEDTDQTCPRVSAHQFATNIHKANRFKSASLCSSFKGYGYISNRQLNYLRMSYAYSFEKIIFSLVRISGSISLKIKEEHGIHCMPCLSLILSEMTR